ncbi:MAG: hypothetical protein EXS67_03755 [Candidatus Margulisbacteria bacterium]|nr:hypothetical protein [Candidatus Margulisiibacteriota bacterium]
MAYLFQQALKNNSTIYALVLRPVVTKILAAAAQRKPEELVQSLVSGRCCMGTEEQKKSLIQKLNVCGLSTLNTLSICFDNHPKLRYTTQDVSDLVTLLKDPVDLGTPRSPQSEHESGSVSLPKALQEMMVAYGIHLQNLDEIKSFTNKYLPGFPPEGFWRLCVPFAVQSADNPAILDNPDKLESHYYKNMLFAYHYAFKHCDDVVTVPYIKYIHQFTMVRNEIRPKGFADAERRYEFPADKIEPGALKELEDLGILSTTGPDEKFPSYLEQYYLKQNQYFVTTNYYNRKDSEVLLQSLLDVYHQDISVAESADKKLSAVAKFIRSCMVTHLFHDGNHRALVYPILNSLLIKNGLKPCILDDSRMFKGYKTLETLVKEIKTGQDRYQQFCTPVL